MAIFAPCSHHDTGVEQRTPDSPEVLVCYVCRAELGPA